MRKTGIFILLLLLGAAASCHREERAPAEAGQERSAAALEQEAVEQGGGEAGASPAASKETGEPRISFDQKDYDFGTLESGENLEHIYKFRNTGEGPLVIHKVRSS